METIVVIGAGQAGIEAAADLRRRGFAGCVTVVGDETHAPYQRPPLSKELLAGALPATLDLYPHRFYDDQRIQLRLGRRVSAIDRQAQRIAIGADTLPYDHLLIATGSRPRPLVVPGLESAIALRTRDDAARLLAGCESWGHVAIVGGGFIGLEVATYLRSRGIAVTVLEAAPQLMGRVVSPTVAAHFLALHRASGTDVRMGQSVVGAEQRGEGARLLLSTGHAVEADAVIAAVGALANDDLAASAGLAVDRGIVVDELLLTSDPFISAIGDCAVHPDPASGRPVRLESVQNAVDQGKAVAARLMGDAQPYRSLPWFWSTQGAAKLQIAGLAFGETTDVVRPSADPSRLTVFRFRDGCLLAVETVNQPGDHLLARRLLAKGAAPSQEQAADPGFNLKTLL